MTFTLSPSVSFAVSDISMLVPPLTAPSRVGAASLLMSATVLARCETLTHNR
jgi:hypothetical protein